MNRDASSSFSIVDVLLIGFGLFLCSLSISDLQAANYLGAASNALLGLGGLLLGLRPLLERILEREVPRMNQAAVGCVILGIVLLVVELLV